MFLPGFASFGTLDAAGVLGSVYRAALQTQVDTWFEGLLETDPGPGLPAVLFHAGETPAPSVITTLTVDSKVATQRRRLR